MVDITMFVYYDLEKPYSVIRPENPFIKELELLGMLAEGLIVGFDVVRIKYIRGKRIRSVTGYRLDGDCNAVVSIPF